MIRSKGRRAGSPNSGYTLVEVMVSLVILVIAISGYSSAILSTSLSADTTRELRLATESAWSVMERLQGVGFDEAFARFNSDPEDDPDGAGSATGSDFEIIGLAPIAGDGDGSAGEVLLPAVWVDGDLQIREDVEIPELGMPRDLSGDGVIDAADHSDDYIVLPVLVRMSWQGSSGEMQLEYGTTLIGL